MINCFSQPSMCVPSVRCSVLAATNAAAACSAPWAHGADCLGPDALLTRYLLPLPLLLVLQPSKCDVECMTVARACAQVSDELDLSDLSEALFKGHKRSALSSEACHESTEVCRKKPPPVPKVHVRGDSCASSCATACLSWCEPGFFWRAAAAAAASPASALSTYTMAACRYSSSPGLDSVLKAHQRCLQQLRHEQSPSSANTNNSDPTLHARLPAGPQARPCARPHV